MITFLARLVEDGVTSEAFGIGVDEATAILIDENGLGALSGSGSAYFLHAPGRPELCDPGVPLTFRNVSTYRISESGRFDFATWRGHGGTAYFLSAQTGELTSTQAGGEIY